MLLRTKIVTIAVGSVFITAVAGLMVQKSVIRQQGIETVRESMRATILGAENARQSISLMRSLQMFDDASLKADAAGASDYRQTKFYKTVPVVAAWNQISEVAAKAGYVFRVPAHNPRNAKNVPGPDEERILSLMENDRVPEYFAVDEKANEAVYARPIVLSNDCLACHGDPVNSASKDGKDILGFHMEGWHEGDRHGIFLLRSNLDKLDAVVQAGMLRTALWLFPLSICIGLGVFFLISRISRQLLALVHFISSGSAEVTKAVGQISSSNQSLAQGASEQAASLEETSASTEEITSTTRRNADNSRLAAEEMEKVDSKIRDSNTALAEMIASMTDIKASSGKIGKIIKVIDEIAFQTNILALNAAVEAARAGVSGAGFAVVADEVRNLAQRSAQAARDTAPLIEESIAKSDSGSAKVAQVADVIRTITESAAKVKILVDEVNLGSQEQARGIEQVAKAILEIQQVTQNSAASSQESAAASQELSAQAEAMDDIAQQLRTVVVG